MSAALFEAIQGAIDAVVSKALQGVHTSCPGVVESFDNGIISVQPTVSIIGADGEAVKMPVIVDVPVVYPRSGEFSITFPLKKGDGVLLVFCETSIDGYHETGGVSTQSDSRRHSLTDAVAIPGFFGKSLGKAPKSWGSTEINFGDSVIEMKKDGTIDMNSGALTVKK